MTDKGMKEIKKCQRDIEKMLKKMEGYSKKFAKAAERLRSLNGTGINSENKTVIDENAEEQNNVCSYCFVYVDTASKSAYVEPVSTREKYRHKGIGTAMMHGVMLKCKELGVEKCYVNSYDWRRKFYNASGFATEDTIGFYHKKI